jgi:hypothetical protein
VRWGFNQLGKSKNLNKLGKTVIAQAPKVANLLSNGLKTKGLIKGLIQNPRSIPSQILSSVTNPDTIRNLVGLTLSAKGSKPHVKEAVTKLATDHFTDALEQEEHEHIMTTHSNLFQQGTNSKAEAINNITNAFKAEIDMSLSGTVPENLHYLVDPTTDSKIVVTLPNGATSSLAQIVANFNLPLKVESTSGVAMINFDDPSNLYSSWATGTNVTVPTLVIPHPQATIIKGSRYRLLSAKIVIKPDYTSATTFPTLMFGQTIFDGSSASVVPDVKTLLSTCSVQGQFVPTSKTSSIKLLPCLIGNNSLNYKGPNTATYEPSTNHMAMFLTAATGISSNYLYPSLEDPDVFSELISINTATGWKLVSKRVLKTLYPDLDLSDIEVNDAKIQAIIEDYATQKSNLDAILNLPFILTITTIYELVASGSTTISPSLANLSSAPMSSIELPIPVIQNLVNAHAVEYNYLNRGSLDKVHHISHHISQSMFT